MRRYKAAFVMQQALGWSAITANLRRVVARDQDVDMKWIPITYEDEGAWIERVPGLSERRRGALRAAAVIARALASERFDAVVFNASWLSVMAAPWTAGVPTAVMLDVTPRQYDRESRFFTGQVADGSGPIAGVKHLMNRLVLRSAAALFPASEWTRRSLLDDYGVDPGSTRVHPFGVDVQAWRPLPQERPSLPQVLFVGGDFQRKGGDLLLDWFRRRGKGRCELRLVTSDPAVVGLRELGINVLPQLQPNSQELRKVFWGSDVFSLPSRSEPFGMAAVEALAAGLPIVTSDAGGLSEIVEDGVSGFRVAAGDGASLGAALDRMIDSPPLRQAMGASARLRAEQRFDAESIYGRMLETVKALVGSRFARGKAAA
jgi:hypothetical protein